MTEVTVKPILDQKTGMALAYYGYENSGIPADKLVFPVPQGWLDIEDSNYTGGPRLSATLGASASAANESLWEEAA